MRQWIDLARSLLESAGSFQPFIDAAKSLPDMRVELQAWPDDNSVFVSWIEGSNGAMPRLCALADQYGVKLRLSVEVYTTGDGGKLVPYYERCGFVIDHSDTGDAFTGDAFDLTKVSDTENFEELLDTVGMVRPPS